MSFPSPGVARPGSCPAAERTPPSVPSSLEPGPGATHSTPPEIGGRPLHFMISYYLPNISPGGQWKECM